MKQWHHNSAVAASVPPSVVTDAARLKTDTADLLDKLAAGSKASAPWLRSLAAIIRKLSVEAWLEAIAETKL